MAISLGMSPQAEAVRDPVCGMTVVPGSSGGGSHVHDGTAYHFCAEMCKRKFMQNPVKYLGGQTEAMGAVTGSLVWAQKLAFRRAASMLEVQLVLKVCLLQSGNCDRIV